MDEFINQITKVYETLPVELQEQFNIAIDETNETDLGYFIPMNPNLIHLCYKTFRELHLQEQDIRNVIHHELEHLMMPWWHHHSQHSD